MAPMKYTIACVFVIVSVCNGYFHAAHECGDEDTRVHLLNACKNSLAALDMHTPPDVSEALDVHNVRNFKLKLDSEMYKKTKDAANQCILCVLHGFSNCDSKAVADSGCSTPAKHSEQSVTAISQSCIDHVAGRKMEKQGMAPLFRKHEVHVEGSHTLRNPTQGPENEFRTLRVLESNIIASAAAAPALKSIADVSSRLVVVAENVTVPAALVANDTTLNGMDDLLSRKIETESALASLKSTASPQLANMTEIGEKSKPFYLCALVNDTKQVDLVCPSGQVMTKVLYASYGTPLKNQLNSTTTAAAVDTPTQTGGDPRIPQGNNYIRQDGYVLFGGDLCFDVEFRTRDECSAYNSLDVVSYSCIGSTQCTLRATGDPNVFPYTFQKLTCDDKLSLYVKVQCESASLVKVNSTSTDLVSKAEASTLVDDWSVGIRKSVVLDFNDPHNMDFLPGMVAMAEGDAETSPSESSSGNRFARYTNADGTIMRPVVRAQIDPPAGYYPSFIADGVGVVSFTCEDSGFKDDDGAIYVWSQNTAQPQLTLMGFFNGDQQQFAAWDLQTNTYRHLTDGSAIVPESTPVGQITDDGVTDGVQRTVQNAPDVLYIAERSFGSGMLTDIKYIQRTGTDGGMPPTSSGIVMLQNKQWYRCGGTNAALHSIVSSELRGTYFFYSQSQSAAEQSQKTAWYVYFIIVVACVMAVTVIAGVVYWKVKGAPKFLSRKRAQQGNVAESDGRLQRTLLYGDEEVPEPTNTRTGLRDEHL